MIEVKLFKMMELSKKMLSCEIVIQSERIRFVDICYYLDSYIGITLHNFPPIR